MRTPIIPPGARHLRSFPEFHSYLDDFVKGHYPFLWIVGRPGVAKTESVQTAVRGKAVYYHKAGQLTPLQFYRDLYEHRGQPVILDDAEHLLDNKIGAKLISALADTSSEKRVCYATTSRNLGDVPTSFLTTSPLLIIANKATQDEAIQSRGPTLYFDPTNLQIHHSVAHWFWDQEIHNWFGQHLHRLPPLDTRWYVIADQDKRAGRDWQKIVLETHVLDRASCIIQDLETDPAYPTREDKALRYTELMKAAKGASRAAYFRLRARLEAAQRLVPEIVPPISLRHTKRPGTPTPHELESMEIPAPQPPAEEPEPINTSARDHFIDPGRGTAPSPNSPRPMVLDDRLPWEYSRPEDEEEDDTAPKDS